MPFGGQGSLVSPAVHDAVETTAITATPNVEGTIDLLLPELGGRGPLTAQPDQPDLGTGDLPLPAGAPALLQKIFTC